MALPSQPWYNSFATFVGPGNSDPVEHFKITIYGLQPNQADLMLAGEYQRGNIREKTFAGVDVDGSPFVPYSATYAKKKGQTNVDLFGRQPSSHMLNAITVRVPEDLTSIDIGIWDDGELASRAQVHNEGATIRTRQGKGGRLHIGAKWGGMGIAHQKKGGKPYSTMPRREFLGVTQEETDKMGEIIVNSIMARQEYR